ncbi:hypothetical protein GYMLUDRAFT_562177 [Collybiopsis luxurians FD-317 M1]|uniref:Uncharacterized protein n=1 Tax=Collybiopsis luxurians FD-317 M1 TaxID=944289 RepID=A0A0D0CS28_9AGAR|nr:hypothetical protein GYMLUDRAFT_562177 [Collybiopsis luxurians FD-317 M1]
MGYLITSWDSLAILCTLLLRNGTALLLIPGTFGYWPILRPASAIDLSYSLLACRLLFSNRF